MSIAPDKLALAEKLGNYLASLSVPDIERLVDAGTVLDDRNFTPTIEKPFGQFYAPFDWINEEADIVLIGITPGKRQAKTALRALRSELGRGATQNDAARIAKQAASFEGDMRTIATALMDRFQLNRVFELNSCADLFAAAKNRAHYTSLLRYPVLQWQTKKKATGLVSGWFDYSGGVDAFKSRMMMRSIREHFELEIAGFKSAWLVPFGPLPARALEDMARRGLVSRSRTVPPLPPEVLLDETVQFDPIYRNVQWQRRPHRETLSIPIPEGRGRAHVVPSSAGDQRPLGALVVEAHARSYEVKEADGARRLLRAVTVMVVNRRSQTRRRFIDVTYAFQVRLEIHCDKGIRPRRDMTGFGSQDPDAAVADLHYADVVEYGRGINTSAGWEEDEDNVVRLVHTDFLPSAEVERVEPNEKIADVEFEMERLAELADDPSALSGALSRLPDLYETWIAAQEALVGSIVGKPRQATARRLPNATAPLNMEIRCANPSCAFTGNKALPILVVDEVIYRRLPAMVIATVDKFAGLPWLAAAGAFFGHVDRADGWGFYGPADAPGLGARLHNGNTLAPPELVIQDELHLISGPLGTVAALYEVAIDRLSTRTKGDRRIRPKVVASTATVRRAASQIEALFDRQRTAIFPPPGVGRRDSFFAQTVPSSERPARLYLGLAAPGKGPKLIFLRALTTLLAVGENESSTEGDVDPYMTALCYFNALRELGGARRIVEDEVRARLGSYGTERRRIDPVDQPFANRRMREVLELTSRESTDKVAAAKDALEKPCSDPKNGVDVALATNMISVGLDIGRLGLMLVQGQPKGASEYIQATSRVGRLPTKPGLILALLNAHKPRDRLHYEGFRYFHACFYRAVEATSVTPWAARALDRALAAVIVAIARHIQPELAPEPSGAEIVNYPNLRAEIIRTIIDRAPMDGPAGGHTALINAIEAILDDWDTLAEDHRANAEPLYYGYAIPPTEARTTLDGGSAVQEQADIHRTENEAQIFQAAVNGGLIGTSPLAPPLSLSQIMAMAPDSARVIASQLALRTKRRLHRWLAGASGR